MTDALVSGEIGDEHLTAPERAVGSVPESVERERDHGIRPLVLDEACGHVRVVVLHAEGRKAELDGDLGRQVLRVQIVGDDLRRDAVESGQVSHGLQERLVGGEVLEVAQVVTGDDVSTACHRHGALQLPTDCQDRARRWPGRRNGSGA